MSSKRNDKLLPYFISHSGSDREKVDKILKSSEHYNQFARFKRHHTIMDADKLCRVEKPFWQQIKDEIEASDGDNNHHHSQKTRTISYAVIAIVAALALVGVVIVIAVVTIPAQEAEAGCERGKAVNQSLLKSSGKCFDQGTF
jgi:ABC 3 transport family